MSVYRNQPNIDCEAIRDLLPAYSIDALDADEKRLVEDSLTRCPEIEDELTQYQALQERLLFAAPIVQPDHSLKSRLLKAAVTDAAPASNETAPAPASMPKPRLRRRPWLALAAASLAVFLIVTNLYWIQETNRLRDENVAQPEVDNLLDFVASGPVTRVDLVITEDEAAPSASLAWVAIEEQTSWIAWFVGRNLSNPPPETTYSLWLRRDGEPPLNIGQFSVNDEGAVALVFEIAEPIGSFDVVEVTLEAVGSADTPTGEVILATEL